MNPQDLHFDAVGVCSATCMNSSAVWFAAWTIIPLCPAAIWVNPCPDFPVESPAFYSMEIPVCRPVPAIIGCPRSMA